MSDELLPCPFCGGKAQLHGSWDNWTHTEAVICTECGAVVTAWPDACAKLRWNRRADHERD